MAIRIKNLDLNSAGMKRQSIDCLGDIASGTITRVMFVAPVACVVEKVSFYTANSISANTSDSFKFTVALGTASGSTLQVRGAAVSANTSNDLVAFTAYTLTPSANNSLSVGTPLSLQTSCVCQSLSGVLAITTYRPLLHKETK